MRALLSGQPDTLDNVRGFADEGCPRKACEYIGLQDLTRNELPEPYQVLNRSTDDFHGTFPRTRKPNRPEQQKSAFPSWELLPCFLTQARIVEVASLSVRKGVVVGNAVQQQLGWAWI